MTPVAVAHDAATAPLVCDGLVVVDLTQGMAGPMAAMILADHGAHVTKVEPPAGDWARRRLRGAAMWNRGKRSIALDLGRAVERDTLDTLLAGADVVLTDQRPAVAGRLRLGREDIRRAAPAAIHCHLSTWGDASGLHPGASDRREVEATVAAAAGRMVGLDLLSGRVHGATRLDPTFCLPPMLSYGAAMLAVHGVLGCLVAGGGRPSGAEYLETSLIDGATAFLMRHELARPMPPRTVEQPDLVQRGIELCFITAECADGRFIQMCARQDHHFRSWLRLLGLEALLDEPRFRSAPMGIESFVDADELELLLRARMRTRTQREWMDAFMAIGDIGADPLLTPAEFLEHPQMVLNGRVVDVDDPALGPTRQVGALVALDGITPRRFAGAPRVGAHDTGPVPQGGRAASAPASSENTGRAPLAGVTVLELAYFVAGPLATTLLAELGARVVKVEPLEGDPYRRTGLQAAKFLHGKESIALDLKVPAAREVLARLVARSDALIHGFRPGVPERLGVDEEAVRAIRPDIVYLNAASYGSAGPEAGRVAFHSTPTALSGVGIAQAGRGNPPVDDSFPDPAAGLGAATALLIGLLARVRRGVGPSLETTMLTSTGYLASNDLVAVGGDTAAVIADGDQLGVGPFYRIYPCAGERAGTSTWLLVAAMSAEDVATLAEILGVVLEPGAPAADVIERIAARTADRTAEEWAATLADRGVPHAVVDETGFEAWLERHEMLAPAEHPTFGDYYRVRPRIRFAERPPTSAPACAVGEHTLALLTELGYDDSAIATLAAAGAIRR